MVTLCERIYAYTHTHTHIYNHIEPLMILKGQHEHSLNAANRSPKPLEWLSNFHWIAMHFERILPLDGRFKMEDYTEIFHENRQSWPNPNNIQVLLRLALPLD